MLSVAHSTWKCANCIREKNENRGFTSDAGINIKRPQIHLQGQRFVVYGFTTGSSVNVKCEDGKLVVTKENNDLA